MAALYGPARRRPALLCFPHLSENGRIDHSNCDGADWQKRPPQLTWAAIRNYQGRAVYLGPPPRSSLFLALLVSTPLLADDLFLDNQPLPQVLTATRLKQSAAAVPGSMTVIDSELIKASGARDIAELLRLVPGMMV
eukprot:gene2403-3125_t